MNAKHCEVKTTLGWRGVMAAIVAAVAAALPVHALPHNVAAANIFVVQNDPNDTTNSVTVTAENLINDFRLRLGSSRGDYNIQIGDDPLDDQPNGLLLSSVAQNGRDNFGTGGKTNCISAVDFNASGYWIPTFAVQVPTAGQNAEYNVNVAGAYFPYTTWLGAIAKNAAGVNGSATVTNDILVGSPQLQYGVNYIDKSAGAGTNAGKATVDLHNLGIDSRTDGVLLVNGAKNENSNYGLSQVNTNDGTWNIFLRDGGGGGNGENDPICFLFVPRTNTAVISGRFLGDASIDMYSGNSPAFTVSKIANGRYELKIPGHAPTNGVLIISAEGGGVTNFDNIVSYERNAALDGWIIESRDTAPPSVTVPPVLESPAPKEGVVSFVYIPAAGVTVGGANNLQTTEAGGTASFTVVLDTRPTNTITIPVSSSNTAEGTVSPDTLTFDQNNWNIPQTVTVTGQDDSVADGPVNYSIVLGTITGDELNYAGYDPADVNVVNLDNEGGISVVPTSGLTTTEAGGTATFAVHLNTQPSADVTIGLSSSNPNEGTVSPSSLTFTSSDWDQDKIVTVTGVDDVVDDGDVAYTIITAPATSADSGYNNINAADVTVTNLDNDTASVLVSLQSVSVIEGKLTNYTVVLATKPTADVTVSVVSSDTAQGGGVAPSSLTFTPLNWNTPKTVTITAADDLVADGNTSYGITNIVSSADSVYAALAPVRIAVTTLDNEAQLTLPSGDGYYGIGQAGVGIDGRASIIDTNFGNYSATTLTVAITNAAAGDVLAIRNTGTGTGQVGVSGNTVTYGGASIGTFTGGSGATPLVVTFNNLANPAAAQAVLQSVTFCNTNSSPSLNYRTISAKLTHSDGGVASGSTRIRVSLLRMSDFQEGADHGYGAYSGQADIALREADPNTPYPNGNNGTNMFVDFADAGSHNSWHVLMRFDNIYGTNAGQIPIDAVIVSAELVLRFTDSGDGTPLYRMLHTWDPNFETWSSIGLGIDADDSDARSVYDSQIMMAAAGTTGLGVNGVSVLPDIIAWQTNEVNYGWGMMGFSGKNNGTGFSSSKAVSVDDRPRLRVTWLPAGTASASFRDGVNGYTNEVDTFVRTSTPDSNYFPNVTMFSDWSAATNGDNDQLLFRFDNIIGNGAGQIPPGATIHAAMLDLGSVTGQAQGDGGQFFRVLQPWDATTTTWNTWNNGIQNDGIETLAVATAVAGNTNLDPNILGGYHSFDLTSDLQAWANGAANNGWAVLPWANGGDGWGIAKGQNATERDRPQLRVFYTPNTNFVATITIGSISRTASTVTIQFSGAASTTYNVQRTTTLGSGWGTVGTASTAGNGTATYTDNAPPAGAAFYRISN